MNRLLAALGIVACLVASWFNLAREFAEAQPGLWAPGHTISADDLGCGVMNAIRPSPQVFGG